MIDEVNRGPEPARPPATPLRRPGGASRRPPGANSFLSPSLPLTIDHGAMTLENSLKRWSGWISGARASARPRRGPLLDTGVVSPDITGDLEGPPLMIRRRLLPVLGVLVCVCAVLVLTASGAVSSPPHAGASPAASAGPRLTSRVPDRPEGGPVCGNNVVEGI